MSKEVSDRIAKTGIVPVVVIENVKDAVPAAKALLAGGIDVMEITLRTKAGFNSIRTVTEQCADMLVGAGTVLTLEQARLCVEAGAKFIVSPGFQADMVKWCVENDVFITPGCVTPSEIMAAVNSGCDVLKFFPANIFGGFSALKALAGPFGNVKFIPTGGVNNDNIGDYFPLKCVHAVGGSWICTKEDISVGNFDRITELSRTTIRKIALARDGA